MKTVEKLLAFGSAVALAVGLAQCDNSGTNNTPADMATPAADLATTPPDLVTFNAPVITTVAPSWGINNAPTMITITGTDFRSGATVTVGGQACSNPTVTATQIMCTVPAKATTCAAQDVVVTNPVDLKTATKTGGFTYTTSMTTLAAAPTPTLTSGTNPRRTASGDFNGDSKVDLVTMNYGSNTFSLFLGNGDGTFQAKKDTNTGTMPTDAVVVDINGDKKLDVLVTHLAVNAMNVYLGNGDGTFLTPKVVTTPTTQPVAFELADLNGDAKLDAVFGSFNSGNIYVHLGNGDGTFQTGQMNAIAGVTQIAGLDLADVNADQKLDIVAVGANTNMAYVLLSSGNGAFQASKMAGAVNMQPQHIMAGDVTGDGKIDLVISNSSSNNVSLLPGVGDGTFMTKKDFAVGMVPQQVLLTDINGDGMLDAFTANTGAGSNNVNLLPGVGANGFGTAVNIPTGVNSTPQGVHTVDVNGDKLLDLVTSNLGNATVGIFLQLCK